MTRAVAPPSLDVRPASVWVIENLGTLGTGPRATSWAKAINDAGTVVGATSVGTAPLVQAFRRRAVPPYTMEPLGALAGLRGSIANDINSTGWMAVTAFDFGTPSRGMRVSPSLGVDAIPTPAGEVSHALGIGPTSEIVGFLTVGRKPRAIRYRLGTLRFLGGQADSSKAFEIDGDGNAVGALYVGGNPRATLWRADGSVVDISSGADFSIAFSLTSPTRIVGAEAFRGSGPMVPAVRGWNAVTRTSLGLFASSRPSWANDISRGGRAVGIAGDILEPQLAYTWYLRLPGLATEEALPPLTVGSDAAAEGVNRCGTVVGYSDALPPAWPTLPSVFRAVIWHPARCDP